jgi:NAD(P)H-nitrite reductase large subunit
MLGQSAAYAVPRIVLQLKSEGIDLRSAGRITPRPGDEEFHAAAGQESWWRLVLHEGALVGGCCVGPPGSGAAFGRLLAQERDLQAWRKVLATGQVGSLLASLA